jgi:protein TonB
MMKRWIASILVGASITLASFYAMALMISGPHSRPNSSDDNQAMQFIRVKRAPDLDVRKRKKPEPPKKPATPPKVPKMNVAQNVTSPMNTPQMDMPKFDLPMSLGNGPALGGSTGPVSKNADVVPIVRIEPRYPRKAAISGIEGWVQLKFDISESGTVKNVEVLNAKPKRVFDRAAIQSLLKWKYKPKMIEGKPSAQNDNKVQIDFKLRG